jgi:hypothetical protein
MEPYACPYCLCTVVVEKDLHLSVCRGYKGFDMKPDWNTKEPKEKNRWRTAFFILLTLVVVLRIIGTLMEKSDATREATSLVKEISPIQQIGCLAYSYTLTDKYVYFTLRNTCKEDIPLSRVWIKYYDKENRRISIVEWIISRIESGEQVLEQKIYPTDLDPFYHPDHPKIYYIKLSDLTTI